MEQENFVFRNDSENRESELKKFREAAKEKFEIERKLTEKSHECEELFNRFKV